MYTPYYYTSVGRTLTPTVFQLSFTPEIKCHLLLKLAIIWILSIKEWVASLRPIFSMTCNFIWAKLNDKGWITQISPPLLFLYTLIFNVFPLFSKSITISIRYSKLSLSIFWDCIVQYQSQNWHTGHSCFVDWLLWH